MIETPIIYRSTHPDVFAWWDDAQERGRQYAAAIKELEDEYPGYRGLVLSQSDRRRLHGLVDADQAPPGPWRYEKRWKCWVPSRTSPAGKALSDRVKEIRWAAGDVPGMPSSVDVPGHFYSPGAAILDGAAWATWPSVLAPETIEADPGYDASMWERAKLSAYYAAKEAAAEAQKVEST